jgi:hypothetical protein
MRDYHINVFTAKKIRATLLTIDKFEAVMEREGEGGRQRGFFVGFGYTKDAEQECAASHKRTGRIIKLLTVQEILDEEHVQKM